MAHHRVFHSNPYHAPNTMGVALHFAAIIWWKEELTVLQRGGDTLYICCKEHSVNNPIFTEGESGMSVSNTLFLDFCPMQERGSGWPAWLRMKLSRPLPLYYSRYTGRTIILCSHFPEGTVLDFEDGPLRD